MRAAESIMMPTAMMTATTMMLTSLTIPTAVMTESSEKITSSSMICSTTAVNEGGHARADVAALALQPFVNLVRGLGQQEEAAGDEDQVASPEISWPSNSNNGAVSRITQEMAKSMRMRITSARPSPT